MAYISKEQVAGVKSQLKKEFPGFKFSVTRKNYSALNVAILAAPLDFGVEYKQINHYHLGGYQHTDVLKRITEIANKGNYDNSDAMTDYFDHGFYLNIQIGAWDKPFVFTGN